MSYTGTEYARGALREIGVLDPTEDGGAEVLADALAVGTDMLDAWRNDGLTVEGVTRTSKNLTANTQDYTIGSGGSINTNYPNAIHAWSVVPDRTATSPLELPMGRPLTYDEWQAVPIKSQTGSYPLRMYFDRAWSAGLGNCSFHPIQTGSTVQAILYATVPAIVSLVANTTYDLRPGFARAIKLNLAWELVQGRFKRQGDWSGLERRAMLAKGSLMRKAIIPLESPMRPEYSIGSGRGRRTFNVRTGAS